MPATKNHAAEFIAPDGKLCKEKITPELRAKYDALLATSTPVERLHALGKASDKVAGQQRADSRAGIALGKFNHQDVWLDSKAPTELEAVLQVAWREARLGRRLTMKQQRIKAGKRQAAR